MYPPAVRSPGADGPDPRRRGSFRAKAARRGPPEHHHISPVCARGWPRQVGRSLRSPARANPPAGLLAATGGSWAKRSRMIGAAVLVGAIAASGYAGFNSWPTWWILVLGSISIVGYFLTGLGTTNRPPSSQIGVVLSSWLFTCALSGSLFLFGYLASLIP